MSAPAPPRLAQLRPRTVVLAVRLMYAGLLVAIIGVAVNALSRQAILTSLEHTNASRPAAERLSASSLHDAADLTYQAFLVMSILAAAVWALMAVANSRGHSWARIVATVLAVLNVLLTIGMATRGTAAATIAEVPTVLVGAAAVWLLWQPPSSRFFEQSDALRSASREQRAANRQP